VKLDDYRDVARLGACTAITLLPSVSSLKLRAGTKGRM